MKYIKEIKEFGELGTDFYNVELWCDWDFRDSRILKACSKRKKNVDEQLKKYKDEIVAMWEWEKKEVANSKVKGFRIVVNGVDINDIDNWEMELFAKKYNV